jgi:bifunctional UDP-N-acetylglucosamine pyrophosphorylase/glucosamine-1-phosphate N-acetyltransferase
MDISQYMDRGVVIHCPESVEIDNAISPEQIAPGVVIHAGSRILGARTSMGPGCIIGAEAPSTVENCQLGHGVFLKGGFFTSATFLDNSEMGSGAHVRAGTLLEEQASAAHTVGLKQTIFMPFVTAGSLINFCDCLMSGGTSRKNHSEIGSSYIHFNFTPRQDKATASLVGDVPRGVMLDQLPIFLGGQGGLVGPARIAYGTTIAAGAICRNDILDENCLFIPPPPPKDGIKVFNQGPYRNIRRIVSNNLLYAGNLYALRDWYRRVRTKYMSGDIYRKACWIGALNQLEDGIQERITQLRRFAHNLPRSLELSHSQDDFPENLRLQQETFLKQWPDLEQKLKQGPPENIGAEKRDIFLTEWKAMDGELTYLDAVSKLNPNSRAAGTEWLQAVVDYTASLWQGE